MNKLERLLRGDTCTYADSEVHGFVNMIGKLSSGYTYDIIIGYVADGDSDYNYLKSTDLNDSCWNNLEFTESEQRRTIKDGLQEGDIIVSKENSRLILGVCGKAIIPSLYNEFNRCGVARNLQELIDAGYKLQQPESTEELVELTIQDISEGKGKGIDPKLIRIKE